MRTEDFKLGVVPILLVLVFSMILVIPLASSGDWVNRPEPGGTTIEVTQGGTFLIRHVLEWDEAENGAYTITLGWYNYGNKPEENLTFVGAEAYFTTGANVGENIRADVTLTSAPSGSDTKWVLEVSCPADKKDSRNGEFNVDITLGAYGLGGVPHIPGDHVIPWHFGGVIVFEKYPQSWNRDPIIIRVGGRGVSVSILPSEKSGLPAQTLSYTVTVKNIGDLDDTYDLTVRDNAIPSWGLTLSENSFEVPAGENRQTTLSVTVPANAPACTKDNVTVTATSRGNPNVSAENNCIAHAAGVDVIILPSYQENENGGTLTYTVTVKNFGVAADNFTLENRDNAGWSLSLDNASLRVPAGENRKTTLRVTIPDNSIGCTSDNITVIATLTENVEIKDNDSCTAHVAIVRRVEVSIDPPYQENENEGTLTYTVTVANTGNVPDTYTLEKADTKGWPLDLEDTSLEVPENENKTTTLTVTIPVDAIGCTEDTVTVTATSTENTAVSDSDNCIAHVTILEGVNVNISPSYRSGVPGAPLTYTITVTNIGRENDDYVLTIENTEPWDSALSDNKLENVQPSEIRILTLSVTIPEDAVPCTEDNVTVTATSQTNTAVSDNASCVAHSVLLELKLYPIDDAEVRRATPDNNYGTRENMFIGYEENAKRVFLKFKLENIPADATIESAELSLRVGRVSKGGENVQCYRVDNDDWNERAITWNNQPSVGGFLDNRNCSGMYTRYYWDITSFVKSQWENENDRIASFGMIGAGENNPTTHWAEFYTKEKADNQLWPFLRIFYRTSANSFSVSISPTYQSALRGSTLNYTVTVKNVGWENGTYILENRDDAGWENVWLDKVLFENVPPGENRTATLTVIIPDNASPGTRDNITVIATLVENKNIRGYASCVAHYTGAVEVTITPTSQIGLPRWPLTYEVTVTNWSVENDNFSLEVDDNMWWRLTLDNNLFKNIPLGKSVNTKLRVTVPVGPPPSTIDEITVTATSHFDNAIMGSASCIARVGFAAVGVKIEQPENQSGLPGENLTYTITITNRGNVKDTYDLSVGDSAGWGPTLSENLLENIENGTSRNITLTVAIPDNAPICTRDNITVTATSRSDNKIENSASCIAHSGFAAVEVSITPENQSGEADYNMPSPFDLEYTVTVANKGTITDIYILTISSDNAKWKLSLTDNTLKVLGGENGTTKLYVEIPLESVPLSTSNITVTATSQTDNTVSDSTSGVAGVAIVDFEISLSPSYQRALLGKDLYYTLTFTNTGTGATPKIHYWSVKDTENWITPENYKISVSAGESTDAYLTVRVPDNVILRPNAAGTYQEWGVFGTGDYHWDRTSDLSDENGVMVTGSTTLKETLNLDNTTQTGTINSVTAYLRALGETPSTVSTNSPSSTPAGTWTDPTYAYVSDNTYAYTSTGDATQQYGNYGFNIPSDATILKVEVGYEAYTAGDEKIGVTCSWDNGANWATEVESRTLGTSDPNRVTWVDFTGATTWTPDKLSNANFQTRAKNIIAGAASNVYLDWIPVRVTYYIAPKFKLLWRTYGTDYESDNISSTSSFADYSETRTTNPNTGSAWTWDEVNVLEVGARASALGPSDNIKISEFWVVVYYTLPYGTKNNLVVTVNVSTFSQNTLDWITKEASAIAEATTLKNEVLILLPPPKLKKGMPGDNVTFPVVVRNLGLENDTYDLTVVDDALPSWNWRFDDNPLENVENGSSRSTTLRVTIPDNALPGMMDNLMVIATSRKDLTIDNSDNCMVLVENFKGVEVSISPENKSGAPGETLTYEVKVKNKGNISDTYTLTATDSTGWGPTLSKNSLELAPQASDTVTLTVTIPSGTSWGAQDTITITAKSTQDPTVSDKASCIASVVERGVEVYISPFKDIAEPGKTLTFTVTVRNKGDFADNYNLTVSDNASWGATLADNLLTVPAGENRTTTVSVKVPSDAVENESTEITVAATSQAAPTVHDSASCIATAKSPVPKGIPFAIPLAISAFLIGGAILAMVYLPRVRAKRAAQPWLLGDRGRPGAAVFGMGRKKAARRGVFRDASFRAGDD